MPKNTNSFILFPENLNKSMKNISYLSRWVGNKKSSNYHTNITVPLDSSSIDFNFNFSISSIHYILKVPVSPGFLSTRQSRSWSPWWKLNKKTHLRCAHLCRPFLKYKVKINLIVAPRNQIQNQIQISNNHLFCINARSKTKTTEIMKNDRDREKERK